MDDLNDHYSHGHHDDSHGHGHMTLSSASHGHGHMTSASGSHGHEHMTSTLAESEDVRRIKEEWTRLQMASDQRCRMVDDDASIDEELQRKESEISLQMGKKKAPSRLPSLDSMVDRVPCIPSMEISTGIGKKLPELGSVGHRLGIIADPKELEPQPVILEETTYNFDEDSPTQTDVKWSPPANASNFHMLTYEIEVDGGQGWTPLTDSRLPIVRVYFTSEKIILGRFSKAQEREPVAVRLRIRAKGVIKRQNVEETINGQWSEEIWLSIKGSSITNKTAV